jgi:hypothetical protein
MADQNKNKPSGSTSELAGKRGLPLGGSWDKPSQKPKATPSTPKKIPYSSPVISEEEKKELNEFFAKRAFRRIRFTWKEICELDIFYLYRGLLLAGLLAFYFFYVLPWVLEQIPIQYKYPRRLLEAMPFNLRDSAKNRAKLFVLQKNAIKLKKVIRELMKLASADDLTPANRETISTLITEANRGIQLKLSIIKLIKSRMSFCQTVPGFLQTASFFSSNNNFVADTTTVTSTSNPEIETITDPAVSPETVPSPANTVTETVHRNSDAKTLGNKGGSKLKSAELKPIKIKETKAQREKAESAKLEEEKKVQPTVETEKKRVTRVKFESVKTEKPKVQPVKTESAKSEQKKVDIDQEAL